MTTRRLLTVATATAFGVGLTAASLFGPPTIAVAAEHEGAGDHAAHAVDAHAGHDHAAHGDHGDAAVQMMTDGHAGHGDHAATALVVSDVSLDQAHAIVAAAVAKAAAIDTKMDIAVVDAGGNLKAFVRMDGAWLGSIDIAIKKAKTARFFDMPTGNIGGLSQPGGPLFGIEHSNGGLITFPGGVPLKNAAGQVIGAIGVSGSTVENDHAVAAAGAGAL